MRYLKQKIVQNKIEIALRAKFKKIEIVLNNVNMNNNKSLYIFFFHVVDDQHFVDSMNFIFIFKSNKIFVNYSKFQYDVLYTLYSRVSIQNFRNIYRNIVEMKIIKKFDLN